MGKEKRKMNYNGRYNFQMKGKTISVRKSIVLDLDLNSHGSGIRFGSWIWIHFRIKHAVYFIPLQRTSDSLCR